MPIHCLRSNKLPADSADVLLDDVTKYRKKNGDDKLDLSVQQQSLLSVFKILQTFVSLKKLTQ